MESVISQKLSYEVLWRVLLPILISVVLKITEKMYWLIFHSTELQFGQVTDVVKEFDVIHQDYSTYCYWRQYMHMVFISLRFMQAI